MSETIQGLLAAEHVLTKRLPATTDPETKRDLIELALVLIAEATEDWALVEQGLLGKAALAHAHAMRLLCRLAEVELCRAELTEVTRDASPSELLEFINRRFTEVFNPS